MTEPDPVLERALVDLGAHLDHPRVEALPSRVAAVLRADPLIPARPRTRRRIAIGLAALAAVGGVAVAPAVADWFSPRGVRIEREPAPEPSSPGAPLALGRSVTLSEARDAVDFDIVVPRELGPPDETWLGRTGDVQVVSLLYTPRRGLPEAGTTGVGALITEFETEVDQQSVVSKFAPKETTVEPVLVGGARGLWLEGVHDVGFVEPGGELVPDRLRLADRVLVWERGDVTLRLETALDRDATIRLAESMG